MRKTISGFSNLNKNTNNNNNNNPTATTNGVKKHGSKTTAILATNPNGPCRKTITWLFIVYSILITYQLLLALSNQRQQQHGDGIIQSISTSIADDCNTQQVPVNDDNNDDDDDNSSNNNNERTMISNDGRSRINKRKRKRKQSKRMMAILHIGPHKTGTTTIQYEIQRLTPELWLDGYEVPSTYNNASSNHYRLAHCLKQDIILHNRSAREYCHSTYLTSIVRIAARESSIILSAERFATPEIDYPQLELVLLPWKRHLRIVGYYRHYYSWFISWHNQIMKRKPDIATRSTIVQWIEDRKRVNGLYHTIYVMGSIRRYQDYFGASNVFVYNTHDPNYNLLYNFFCVAIPNANNSCSTVQMELQQQQSLPPITRMEKEENNSDDDYEKKNVSTILSDSMSTSLASTTTTTSGNSTAIRKKNSAVVLIYQDIAYAMKRKYHILLRRRQKNSTASSFVAGQKFPNDTTPKDYTIQQLSKMVQYHHEIVLNRVSPNNFNASYVQCPTPDSLEYLFNLTKQAYETFFPNSNNNAGEDEILSKLRHDFEMASKTVNELCSIDAVSLINNDPEWNQYFNSVFEIYT